VNIVRVTPEVRESEEFSRLRRAWPELVFHAHERLGAELLGIAPDSLISEGTVADLEEWCALAFPESGSYVVEGALVPVEIDLERDRGSYREPNVWMRHASAAG